MENTNKEIKTPNNKLRSLGLRRSAQRSTIKKTPLSDVKVSYHSLQNQSSTEVSSPCTPRLSQTIASSTSSKNCLPYRLTLNRGAREKYKKKKLEFAANNLQVELESERPLDLHQEVANKEQILQRHQKHKQKVDELKSVIAIWAEAFKASLEELSSKIEPKMEAEDLIARLGIPPDMIDYT
ncbi:uncharacterized protein LOC129939645 [Eupeodes corollae]|uniref:uncharacterized protein LOC129939645 n=1 Tax=Eupeodes corollae TaxID=290404 RepID=UPI0024907802|nr:uncharacterized protein LOC129939645 [Eupeodes corollae]